MPKFIQEINCKEKEGGGGTLRLKETSEIYEWNTMYGFSYNVWILIRTNQLFKDIHTHTHPAECSLQIKINKTLFQEQDETKLKWVTRPQQYSNG